MIENKKFQEIVLDFMETQSRINTMLYNELCNVAHCNVYPELANELKEFLKKNTKEE